MKNFKVVVVLLGLLSLSAASFAGFYKCSLDGKVIYSDVPCGADQKKIDILKEASPRPGNKVESTGDYYSVENQLKRLEQSTEDKRQVKAEEQARDDERQTRELMIKEQKNSKLDHAKCEYYQSLVKEEEHHYRQGYQSREHRLSDESNLKRLRVSEAEYCNQ